MQKKQSPHLSGHRLKNKLNVVIPRIFPIGERVHVSYTTGLCFKKDPMYEFQKKAEK